MLVNQTVDKLRILHLSGMVRALAEQMEKTDINTLSFDERLGFLVDRELIERENRKLKNRLHKARLKLSAAVEDIDYGPPRGIDKSLIKQLAT